MIYKLKWMEPIYFHLRPPWIDSLMIHNKSGRCKHRHLCWQQHLPCLQCARYISSDEIAIDDNSDDNDDDNSNTQLSRDGNTKFEIFKRNKHGITSRMELLHHGLQTHWLAINEKTTHIERAGGRRGEWRWKKNFRWQTENEAADNETTMMNWNKNKMLTCVTLCDCTYDREKNKPTTIYKHCETTSNVQIQTSTFSSAIRLFYSFTFHIYEFLSFSFTVDVHFLHFHVTHILLLGVTRLIHSKNYCLDAVIRDACESKKPTSPSLSLSMCILSLPECAAQTI